VTYWVAFGD